jgi:hypothetical protein
MTEPPATTDQTASALVAPPDAASPRLRLTAARRQSTVRSRRVVVGAQCDERCNLSASAQFRHASIVAARPFRPVKRQAAARTRVTLTLRITSGALKGLKRVARKARRALVRVEVTASDAAGNRSRATCYIAVR